VKFSLQLAAVSVLLFIPRMRLPSVAVRAVLPIAAASYHIYLFHRILPDLLLPQPDPMAVDHLAAIAAVASGIAVGLAVFALHRVLAGLMAARRTADVQDTAAQGA
jgi:hypothetical protein